MNQGKSDVPSKLKAVTYTRAVESMHTAKIFLVGDSRWLRDIELLLEDTWKNIYCPPSLKELSDEIAASAPVISIVEKGAFQNSELRLIESVLPKCTHKIIVTNDTSNELGWRSLNLKLCALGVSTLVLSKESNLAAKELTEVLGGLLSVGSIGSSDSFKLIRDAYQGYSLLKNESTQAFEMLFRYLASKFAFDAMTLSAAMILAETYSQWKAPKAADSELHLAYLQAEHLIDSTPLKGLLQLAVSTLELTNKKADLNQQDWDALLKNSGLGRLTLRKLSNEFENVKVFIQGKSNVRPLRRVA